MVCQKPNKKVETAQTTECSQEKPTAATNTAPRPAPPTMTSAAATNTPNPNERAYAPEDNMINFGTFKVGSMRGEF